MTVGMEQFVKGWLLGPHYGLAHVGHGRHRGSPQ